MNANRFPQPFPLPELSDEAAAEIHNFLEVAIQIFETCYRHQIDRHYDSLAPHNIIQSHPPRSIDDPPF